MPPIPSYAHSSIQGTLSAFNPANGQEKWRFAIGGPTPCTDPVADKEGTIYTAVPPPINAQTAAVVAINPDGTQKWRYEEYNRAASSPALSNDESEVYVALNNHLIAFSASGGHILWTQNGDFVFSMAPVVNSQDSVLITSLFYDLGFVHAYSKSGTPLWTSQNVGLIVGSPVLDTQGRVVIVSEPLRSLFILNSQNGSIIISVPLSAVPLGSRSVIDKDDIVYKSFYSDMGAIDNNGIKWLFSVSPERIVSTPALGANNVLYFTSDNTIWALGE